jgi:hypothetical protein
MAAHASAYAVLGLDPGADAAAVDRAYRRLIKRYHPDREGGDASRAAEINRAYRELRGPRSTSRELVIDDSHPFDGPRTAGSGWVRAALTACALLALLLVTVPWMRLFGTPASSSPPTGEPVAATARAPGAMDEPLELAAVDAAVREAVRIARSEDEVALADASRECHRRLRVDPSLAELDRCAAFDDAVVELQDRDPLRDRGPFSELAVTRRQMTGGTLFSNDYLAIDGRLDRIRLQVELVLAPQLPPPVVNSAEGD